jgi:hypothetical protein
MGYRDRDLTLDSAHTPRIQAGGGFALAGEAADVRRFFDINVTFDIAVPQ